MSGASTSRDSDLDRMTADDANSGLRDDLEAIVTDSALAEVETPSVAHASPNTAGGRLRAAREAAGMTVADVAEVLRFSAHQIEALERDDHAHLAGSTLVRGMIRGYAKLLKIESESLLVGLGGIVPVPMPDVRAPTNIGLAEKTTTVARVSRGVVVALMLVGLLFAALTGYVYLMSDVPPSTPTASTVQSQPSVAPVALATSTPPQTVVTDANSAPAPAPVPDVATNLPAKPNALTIDFDDLSWIEITDASQSIVFRGEQPKGTHQVIEGKAPFQLWIGRASAVRVTYGDKVIDLKPYSRDNIARLTVE